MSEIFDQVVEELKPKIKHLDPDLQEVIKAVLYMEDAMPDSPEEAVQYFEECWAESNLSMYRACLALRKFKNK